MFRGGGRGVCFYGGFREKLVLNDQEAGMESSGQGICSGLDDPLFDDGGGRMDGLGETAGKYSLPANDVVRGSTDPERGMVSALLWPPEARVGFYGADAPVGEHSSDDDQFLEYLLAGRTPFLAIFLVGQLRRSS